jgi:hypothetical protein
MTNKEWAIANLTGKVLNRAIRAIEEQPQWEYKQSCIDLERAFWWIGSKEGENYWGAVYDNIYEPDQWLPIDYVEAPEYVGEVEAKTYTEAEVKHIVSEALQSALATLDLDQWFKQFKNSNQ